MSSFNERFNNLKTEKNVTLHEIAESIHISKSSLSKVVNGKMSLRHELIESLANYFNVTKSYLIGESDNRYSEIDLEEGYFEACKMAKEMNIPPESLKKFLGMIQTMIDDKK